MLSKDGSVETITSETIDPDRKREIAKARADLLRRAEAQRIKPVNSLDELAGDPEFTADLDVDEFLRQVSEDRRGSR